MKTILVTSALTFVPGNYDGFVRPLLKSPHLDALIVLENRSLLHLLQALTLVLSGAAPALGLQILRNFFGSSLKQRRTAALAAGKDFQIFCDPNAADCLEYLRSRSPDLILNARTRFIFRKALLAVPKIGCVNIHHGLLPEQRGLMCDLWSHLESVQTGFSFHVMTPKLDDGPIIKATPVPSDQKDYLESIRRSADLEAQTALSLLDELSRDPQLRGSPNRTDKGVVYRRNPGLFDFYRLRRKGVRV